jgi:hypothetical protein
MVWLKKFLVTNFRNYPLNISMDKVEPAKMKTTSPITSAGSPSGLLLFTAQPIDSKANINRVAI